MMTEKGRRGREERERERAVKRGGGRVGLPHVIFRPLLHRKKIVAEGPVDAKLPDGTLKLTSVNKLTKKKKAS